jgi:multidrug efflux pump subunit AcrB
LGRGLSGIPAGWHRFQGAFGDGLERLVERVYQPALRWALSRRYLTVAIATALLAVTLGWVLGGHLPFTFFPPVEAENVAALVTMPLGTPPERTEAAVASSSRRGARTSSATC